MPLISPSNDFHSMPLPSTPDLQRILQMSLVLSTQAKYSSLFPQRDPKDNQRRDEEVRNNVEALGKAVRWRMSVGSEAPTAPTERQNLQRGPSMTQGRNRRRGWRASTNFGQEWGAELVSSLRYDDPGHHSIPEPRWAKTRGEEDDESDNSTPGQSFAQGRTGDSSYSTASTARSTLTAGTIRGESLATYGGGNQRTPQAESTIRRPNRSESSGSSEVNGGMRRWGFLCMGING